MKNDHDADDIGRKKGKGYIRPMKRNSEVGAARKARSKKPLGEKLYGK